MKYLLLATVTAVVTSTAALAGEFTITAEVDPVCEITSNGGTVDPNTDNSYTLEHTCNTQASLTVSSSNGGLVAEGSDSVIPYSVFSTANDQFNAIDFLSTNITQSIPARPGTGTTEGTISIGEEIADAEAGS